MSKKTEKEFMGFNTWEHVSQPKVRAWNQIQTHINMIRVKGVAPANQYFGVLSNKNKQDVKSMIEDIKTRGYETVHREVLKSA